MNKFIKWIAGPIVFGLAFFAIKYGVQWIRNDHQGLTGANRSAFVEGAVGACLKKQKDDPINKGISDLLISQYCNCYANGMADIVSVNELKSFATMGTDQKIGTMRPKADAVVKLCLEAASKSLPHSN